MTSEGGIYFHILSTYITLYNIIYTIFIYIIHICIMVRFIVYLQLLYTNIL